MMIDDKTVNLKNDMNDQMLSDWYINWMNTIETNDIMTIVVQYNMI